MRQAHIVLLVLVLVAVSGYAQTPAGFGPGLFARGDIDARSSAMGEACVAVADGRATAYYNPAGLARAMRLGIGGMYSEPYGQVAGTTFQYVSVMGPLGTQTDSLVNGLGVAVTWRGTTIADIPIWEEQGPGTTFSASASVYSASAGLPVATLADLAVGATVKYYSASILEGRAEGFGLDVGALAAFTLADVPLRVGCNAMDIGESTIYWHGTAGEPKNYIPWVNKIGVAARLFDDKLLIACDFDWAVGRPKREQILHLGVELSLIQQLALRAGWQTNLDGKSSIAAGVGIFLLDSLKVDYAYLPGKILGATSILSVQVLF